MPHSNSSLTKQRYGTGDRIKTNKLDSYTSPSRTANMTHRKTYSSGNSDISAKPKNIITNKRIGDLPTHSYRNNGHRDKAYNDMGNETLALDEVINNAKLDLVPRTDSDEEYIRNDRAQVIPIEVYRSGPRLMTDKVDFEKSVNEMPGEGRTYSSKEEGTKVWQNKTRRKYYEVIPKQNKENYKTSAKAIEANDNRSLSRKMIKPATDDEKFVSGKELDDIFLQTVPKIPTQDYSYSYIPTVRDVGIQCNRKKTNRHLLKNSSNDSGSVRIIKSSNDGLVTVFSDVPQLKPESPSQRTPVSKHEIWDEKLSLPHSEAIYSQVDRSKKKSFNADIIRHHHSESDPNYPAVIYRTPLNERRSRNSVSPHGVRYPSSEYSTNTNRTIKNKTKGIGFRLSSGVDGPNVNLSEMPPSPKFRSRSLNRSYEEPVNDWTNQRPRNGYEREVNQEVLEETISISNASSEDLRNNNIDEFIEPKSGVRELEHKRKDVSYINVSPKVYQRKLKSGEPLESTPVVGRGMWFNNLDKDYRRGMAQNEITYPATNEPSFSTISRIESRNRSASPRDFSPPPRQAYTLDRRHLKEKQRKLETMKNKDNSLERQYKSYGNLSDRSTDEETRGGLAAAYKNRQEKRASSLNRMSIINEDRVSPSHAKPRTHLSHSHLNSTGNSGHSSSESDHLKRHQRQYHHDREPIIMYIPAVSHHNKRAESEPDRLSGILRNNSISSKGSDRKYKNKKAPRTSASSDITPVKPRIHQNFGTYSGTNYGTLRFANDEELDQIKDLRDNKLSDKTKKEKKKVGLSRAHSMPKDTKFPWLQKLKLKVKSKDP